jgi:hypothetical protein
MQFFSTTTVTNYSVLKRIMLRCGKFFRLELIDFVPLREKLMKRDLN